MSLVAVEQITRDDAERLSNRIGLRLDSMADNWAGALPLIREAIEREAFRPLGYASHGAYVADRFGDSLAKLGVDLRREIVRELTDAGLSIRAIAPVVGSSFKTVARDLEEAPVSYDTPALLPDEPGTDSAAEVIANPATGEVIDGPTITETTETFKTKVTIGLDGKTYTSTPKPRREPKPVLSGEAAAQDNAEEMALNFGRALVNLSGLMVPAHRSHVIEDWPRGRDAAIPPAQELATPEMFRAIAVALDQLADEWEKTNV